MNRFTITFLVVVTPILAICLAAPHCFDEIRRFWVGCCGQCTVRLGSVLALLLPSLVYRIKVEEKLLSERFGEAYHRHASQVKRLIPILW